MSYKSSGTGMASISTSGAESELETMTETDGPADESMPAAFRPTSNAILASCQESIGSEDRSARLIAASVFWRVVIFSSCPMPASVSAVIFSGVFWTWLDMIASRCFSRSVSTRQGMSHFSRKDRFLTASISTPKLSATARNGAPVSAARRALSQSIFRAAGIG